MERIQEAIEKARRERQGKIGGQSSAEGSAADADLADVPVGSEAVEEVRVTEKDAGDAAASIRVNYQQTRTVQLDERELKERLIVAGFAHDSRSEPYRQLRGQILQKFRREKWQTLAITSPNNGSGRTLTAMNLAISLSLEANQTVLLVDLDLRNPGVARCIGLDDIEYGIVD